MCLSLRDVGLRDERKGNMHVNLFVWILKVSQFSVRNVVKDNDSEDREKNDNDGKTRVGAGIKFKEKKDRIMMYTASRRHCSGAT